MSDILLEHTGDGGDVRILEGNLAVDDGLSTAVYLSLCGGNDGDDGSEATAAVQYWGNRIAENVDAKLRGSMHALIKASPLTSASLLRIEQAGARDLEWLVKQELAESIAVEASITGVNRVAISIKIQTGKQVRHFGYEVTRAP